MAVKTQAHGSRVITTIVKYQEVGQVHTGGDMGPIEAAMKIIGRDMDEVTTEMRERKAVNLYEFQIEDMKFTIDTVAELPEPSEPIGDSWDDPRGE